MNFEKMNGPQLVEAFNTMVAEHSAYLSTMTDGPLAKFKSVSKFRDRATGVARCTELEAALAKHNAEVANDKPSAAGIVWDPAVRIEKRKPEQESESEDMATKKKAVAKKAVAKEPREGVRSGSNRDKLFKRLEKSLGSQVKVESLVTAVYGSENKEDMKGPLNMVMKGLISVISTQKMPFRIVKEKEGREVTFGLHKA